MTAHDTKNSYRNAKPNVKKGESRTVRYDSLDDMPPPEPFSKELLEMSDDEIERRAADDPEAGALPPDFWDKAVLMEPLGTEQVTLRLPRRVLAHFRAGGKGYQSRISKVLSHYVDAQGSKPTGKKAG